MVKKSSALVFRVHGAIALKWTVLGVFVAVVVLVVALGTVWWLTLIALIGVSLSALYLKYVWFAMRRITALKIDEGRLSILRGNDDQFLSVYIQELVLTRFLVIIKFQSLELSRGSSASLVLIKQSVEQPSDFRVLRIELKQLSAEAFEPSIGAEN
ncbi:hypothetical protein [Teredinibacter purpureus]|uniref:hypothetical protein n=1 Tax=Teredinibacter purpureus TaxID=2731756 RepID=UPI0013C41B2C|nr:hypothetical protein [Teredinibacter purpureus]